MGMDLTEVDGLDVLSVQALISEIGLNMHRWPDRSILPPGWDCARTTRISGGKCSTIEPARDQLCC